jgi:hypothetical protein
MNECMELDLKEMLPDLLHRKLQPDERARVEAHVTRCASCAHELRVLGIVTAATVFAPAIDVDKIVRQIPPYKGVTPAVQTPARSRVVSWLVAASMFVVVAGGGSLLMQQRTAPARVGSIRVPAPSVQTPSASATNDVLATSASGVAPSEQPTHALALAAGVDGLSDGDLRQLMNDMDSFDALPAAEPEPVISVDGGDTPDQGF